MAAAVKRVSNTNLSAIPYIGGPAAEIFAAIIASPLPKRRDKWIESIVEGLETLEAQVDGFDTEHLWKDDTFITTVMHATQTAIRNHQEEKLEALRNIVLNSALPNPPESEIQLMFLNLIDSLTTWHLKVLVLFDLSEEQKQTNNHTWAPDASISIALESAFPELCGRRGFYNQLIIDLFNRGLLVTERSHVTFSSGRILSDEVMAQAVRVTAFGRELIGFTVFPK